MDQQVRTYQQYSTNDKGERIIPATQRADGTWREEIKVRAGYVPQDEVELYVAPHVGQSRIRKENRVTPGYTNMCMGFLSNNLLGLITKIGTDRKKIRNNFGILGNKMRIRNSKNFRNFGNKKFNSEIPKSYSYTLENIFFQPNIIFEFLIFWGTQHYTFL
eukprot:TRINITY_DN6424_c0_g1_i2.p1 TRINITY_DN6424_c0_g1~~TRINITY_DN6424_c0_g1_i2.p1  ORF type:complete len:161 (-),score=7.10 TRINITY_DN6424_c0_g1_i2:117-599(-)